MRLLDLFCKAGGAGMGYHRAGFEVVGVDIESQPRYPFEFIQDDALEYVRLHGHEFDAIHASPPCQRFTRMKAMWNAKQHKDWLTPTRDALQALDNPWVMENVEGAPMDNPIVLCGSMFGLFTNAGAELRRHRLFEISGFGMLVPPCNHFYWSDSVIGIYGGHGRDRRRTISVVGHSGNKGSRSRDRDSRGFNVEARREAMGIDWMTGEELSQAIPPAYTEYIGKQLIEAIKARRRLD
jgi:DNA (cytosine-5)-methyltransferase 1